MGKKRPIRRALKATVFPYARAARSAVEPHRQLMGQLGWIGRQFRKDWQGAADAHERKSRKAKRQAMMRDFEAVKKYWGFTNEQIPEICKNMWIEALVYGVIGVIGALLAGAGGGRGLAYVLSGCALALIGFLPATLNIWRISVLKKRVYRPFGAWLLGRVGEGNNKR